MECLICFLSEKPMQSCPTCNKSFHTSCLYMWGHQTCPHCREPFEFFTFLNTPSKLSKELLASSGMMKHSISPLSYPHLAKIKDTLKHLRNREFYDKLESLLIMGDEKSFLEKNKHVWKNCALYEYATRMSNDLSLGVLHTYQSLVIASFFSDFYDKSGHGPYMDASKLFLTFGQLNL